MKIATYNLRMGGSRRVHWTKLIEEHSVDLLLVQESYPHDTHLPELLYPDARDRSVWEMVEQNGWGSAVFSNAGSVKAVSVPGFSGWVVGAEIQGAGWQTGLADPLLTFSVHAPSRTVSYAKQVDKILDAIGRIAGGREFILGGDFNLTVSCGVASDRPVSKRDSAIQSRLDGEFGLLNCWREANPREPMHQTLRWTGDRSIPYHCDGLFVPKSWKPLLRSCAVLSGDDWNTLSDHNPVVAHFDSATTSNSFRATGPIA